MFPKDCKLAWAIPHTMSMISTATHYSLFGIIRPPNVEYLAAQRGAGIDECRERQAEEAIRLGCTHIWFADGDMVFPPLTLVALFALLEHGADLAGGLCYRGYPPFEPIAWHPSEKRMLLPLKDFAFGDVVEARATGCACLLVKAEVFEKLNKPWFLIRRKKNGHVIAGEDFYFTERATSAGFKLSIWTEKDIDHTREFPVNREIFFMSNLFGKILGKERNWDRVTALWKKLNEDPKWLDQALNKSG